MSKKYLENQPKNLPTYQSTHEPNKQKANKKTNKPKQMNKLTSLKIKTNLTGIFAYWQQALFQQI